MKQKYYAHSKEGRPPEEWQLLEDHLSAVAKLASEFAAAFDSADWAFMGKYHYYNHYTLICEGSL